MAQDGGTRPLTCGDVAKLFNVSAVTVAKWADAGKLPHFKTPFGHRRFHLQDVEKMRRTEGVA